MCFNKIWTAARVHSCTVLNCRVFSATKQSQGTMPHAPRPRLVILNSSSVRSARSAPPMATHDAAPNPISARIPWGDAAPEAPLLDPPSNCAQLTTTGQRDRLVDKRTEHQPTAPSACGACGGGGIFGVLPVELLEIVMAALDTWSKGSAAQVCR